MSSAPEWTMRSWRPEPQWREQTHARFNLRGNRASRHLRFSPTGAATARLPPRPPPITSLQGGSSRKAGNKGCLRLRWYVKTKTSFSQRTKLSNSSLNYKQSIICHISIHKSFFFKWLYVCSGAFCSLQIRYNIH